MSTFHSLHRPIGSNGVQFDDEEICDSKRRMAVFREPGRAFLGTPYPDRAKAFAKVLEEAYQAGLAAYETPATRGPRMLGMIELNPRPREFLKYLGRQADMCERRFPAYGGVTEYNKFPRISPIIQSRRDGRGKVHYSINPHYSVHESTVNQLIKLKLMIPWADFGDGSLSGVWQMTSKAVRLLMRDEVEETYEIIGLLDYAERYKTADNPVEAMRSDLMRAPTKARDIDRYTGRPSSSIGEWKIED